MKDKWRTYILARQIHIITYTIIFHFNVYSGFYVARSWSTIYISKYILREFAKYFKVVVIIKQYILLKFNTYNFVDYIDLKELESINYIIISNNIWNYLDYKQTI